MSNGQGKLLANREIKVKKQNTYQDMFLKSLSCLLNRNLCLKISLYHNIVSQNVSCEQSLIVLTQHYEIHNTG